MPIDPSIALGYKQPDVTQTLGSLLGVKSAQQGMEARALQMQGQQQQNTGNQISLQERQALQPLLSNPESYTDAQGNIDFNKATPMVMRAAPTTGMAVLQQMAAAQEQRTNALRTIATQSDENNQRAAAAIYGATPETVDKTLEAVKGIYPSEDMKRVVSVIQNHLKSSLAQAKQDPDAQKALIQRVATQFLPQQTQQEMNTPQGVSVSNGQETAYVSTKPGTAVALGQDLPGTRVQQQLPPNTPVMGRDANGNPTPGYLGPQPGRIGSPEANASATTPKATQERLRILQSEYDSAKSQADKDAIKREMRSLGGSPGGSGFVASGLPVGQAENISNNVAEMNRHFAALQDQAAGAQLTQSLGGNIKSLAQKAITGSQQDKLSFLNGLLTLIPGQHAQDDLKTATDLLEKNMAQLGLNTPASSDAMRSLVIAARPHSSMTKEAVSDAVDQLVGQVKANMAMRNVLSSYKQYGDVEGYNRMRQKLEQIADPRAWQYMSLGPGSDAAKSFASKLSASDKAKLGANIKQLQEMGILQ